MGTILCPQCNSSYTEKNGPRNGKPRYHCKDCGKFFGESTNRIPIEIQIIAVWLADEQNIASRMIAKILGIKSHNSIIYWRDHCDYSIKSLSNDSKDKIREKANEIVGRLDIVCEYNKLCDNIHSIKREIQRHGISVQHDPKYVEQLNMKIEELQSKIAYLEEQEKIEKDIDKIFKIKFKLWSYKGDLNIKKGELYQCEHAPQQQCAKNTEKKLIRKLNKLLQKANEIKNQYEETAQQSIDEHKFYANRICEKLKKLLRALK